MTGDGYVFKFLQLSVDGKHLMRFHNETSEIPPAYNVDGTEIFRSYKFCE